MHSDAVGSFVRKPWNAIHSADSLSDDVDQRTANGRRSIRVQLRHHSRSWEERMEPRNGQASIIQIGKLGWKFQRWIASGGISVGIMY